MGNPLKVTEDAIEIEDKSDTLNAILKIVTLFTYSYATVASARLFLGNVIIQNPLPLCLMSKQIHHLLTEKRLSICLDILDYI